jgi:hypothetical protein
MKPKETTSTSHVVGLFDDFITVEEFARQAKRERRTILKWMREPGGLPFTQYGYMRLVHIPTARQWLLDRMKRPNARRTAA